MSHSALPPEPLVSVVMSFHNAKDTVTRAIRSLLWQTYSHWELILIDDGSSDGALKCGSHWDDPRIALHRHAVRRGLAVRLNQGVALARGPLLARMDADDVAFPARFERQVGFLRANASIDLLATGALLVDGNDRAVGTLAAGRSHAQICASPWRGFPMPHPTWMGRTTWFRRHPYDESAQKGQDQALLYRVFRNSTYAGLPDVLLGYRYPGLSLRKSLHGRYHYLRAVHAHGHRRDFLLGCIGHAGAAVRDLLAMASGAERRVILRRLQEPTSETLETWTSCLSALASSPDTGRCG